MTPPLFFRTTRAYSFPASIVPVLLGTALALHGRLHTFDPLTFALLLVGAVLAHAGANVINDYFDFVKGVDTRPEHGSGVLTDGTLTPAQAGRLGTLLTVLAAICGALLVWRYQVVYGHPILTQAVTLAVIGLACAVLYPALLKKYGLGDLLIVIPFGIGLTLGAYLLQVGTAAGQWGGVALASLPVALLVDAILHANNIRDAADDRAAHVHTLASVLSEAGSRTLLAVLMFGPLAFVVIGVAIDRLSLWSLLTFIALPLLVRAYREINVPLVAQAHLIFGLPYALSFLLPGRV